MNIYVYAYMYIYIIYMHIYIICMHICIYRAPAGGPVMLGDLMGEILFTVQVLISGTNVSQLLLEKFCSHYGVLGNAHTHTHSVCRCVCVCV